MNMSDLAIMAAQRAQQQNGKSNISTSNGGNGTILEEESPDLKTPTAEDSLSMPEGAGNAPGQQGAHGQKV